MGGQVQAFCIALSSQTKLSDLLSPRTGIGKSGSQIGEPKDDRDEEFEPIFTQGGLSVTVDHFLTIFSPPIPVAVKIDVDGMETSILQESKTLLANPVLTFLSVEVNDQRVGPRDEELALLAELGLELVGKVLTTKYDQNWRNYNFHFVQSYFFNATFHHRFQFAVSTEGVGVISPILLQYFKNSTEHSTRR